MSDTFRPYEGTDPYIFVSYSRKDMDTVLPVVRAASEAGYRVWYDEGIPWTTDWPNVIARKMEGCAACLAFHSATSAYSIHCKAELHLAISEKRPILSVYLEEVQLEPGLKMYLALSQAVRWAQFDGPEAFVARLGEEEAFKPCKELDWNKIGEIQWKLDAQGVLTIARNEDLIWWIPSSIPSYQEDRTNESTAPWMPYREKIRALVIQDYISAIGDYAFSGCDGMTTVSIGDHVTAIGDYAFARCARLTSVTIPDSVTSIGDWAFEGCDSLTAVSIGDHVTSIGGWAFFRCKSLTSVSIGNDVTSIGDMAFCGCASLISVTIPDGVTSIGRLAFHSCVDLASVSIGGGVTTIDGWTFTECEGLTAISVSKTSRAYSSREGILFDRTEKTLVRYPTGKIGKIYAVPDGVTSIGEAAFTNCTGLTSVTIPDSVTSIGDHAFEGCAGLSSITIPDSVTTIGDGAFNKCEGLTSVIISNGVTTIGHETFDGCVGLTSVSIPDSVTTIGGRAFADCAGLTSITIPDSVTSIDNSAFLGCVGLNTINASKTNRAYSSREGILFDRAGKTLVRYPIGKIGKIYVVPDGVTTIGNWAFSGCTGLTSVIISDSVTSIGRCAFDGCTGLTTVTIPDSVTSIDYAAFEGCYGLSSVEIPAGAVLDEDAFPKDAFPPIWIVRRPPHGDGD